VKSLKEVAEQVPVLRDMLAHRYDRIFEANRNAQLYRGVFESYAEAAASSPAPVVGYDQEGPAKMYAFLMNDVQLYDYAVLFWLQHACKSERGLRLFDYGGHVGVKYYAFSNLLGFIDSWKVCDVPAVVREGREIAKAHGAHNLSFTENFEEVGDYETLLCSGSLQYIEQPLYEKLAQLPLARRPKHVLLNLIAFTANNEPEFYTLNSIGTAFCPYKVQNQAAFTEGMAQVGYACRNSWENPGRASHVPFQHQRADFVYRGMYFCQNPQV